MCVTWYTCNCLQKNQVEFQRSTQAKIHVVSYDKLQSHWVMTNAFLHQNFLEKSQVEVREHKSIQNNLLSRYLNDYPPLPPPNRTTQYSIPKSTQKQLSLVSQMLEVAVECEMRYKTFADALKETTPRKIVVLPGDSEPTRLPCKSTPPQKSPVVGQHRALPRTLIYDVSDKVSFSMLLPLKKLQPN